MMEAKIGAAGIAARPMVLVWLAFLALAAAFNLIFQPFFPMENYRVGHDNVLGFSGWVDGNIWFANNGLAPPWFTPSFCAGQPFFGDPQSSYYSLPQLLSLVLGPLDAAYLTLCASVSLLFWGGYLLARRAFGCGHLAAVLVGGVLMFNGFLPQRMLVGHSAFHGFALVPWVALLLLGPVRNRLGGIAAAVSAGVLLAYWVQSGLGTLILAAGLAVVLLALAHGIRGGSMSVFLGRGALAAAVALGLSIAKLWATFSYLSNFPRTFYLLPGGASLFDTVMLVGGGLFLPSEWAARSGVPRLTNLQWALAQHEWAYNFGFASVLLALFLLAVCLVGKERGRRLPTARQSTLWFLLLLGLACPLALNLWTPGWNAFLKTVPIINTASTPLRWVIVYIPLLALALGLLFQRVRLGGAGAFAVGACLFGTVAQTALEPMGFYLSQGYSAAPAQIADRMLREGKWQPKIGSLGTEAELHAGQYRGKVFGNDTFLAGVSQVRCYNPVFGYRLEKFSSVDLRPGSVLAEREGFLNLKNPSCYVYPKENGCRPGDRFRADQMEQAQNFASYRPFSFNVSKGQRAASLVTELSLLAVGLCFAGWLLRAAWDRQ